MIDIKIDELNFGVGNAEQESELLEKVFVETPEFKDILSGRFSFIIGIKGSGKSALFDSLIKNKNNWENIIVPISSINGQVEYEKLFNKEPINNFSIDDFREYWKSLIALKIGVALRTTKKQGLCCLEFTELENLMEGYGIKEILLTKMADDPENYLDILMKFIELIKQYKINYSKMFSLEETILKNWKLKIWFIFDRLDELILSNPETRKNAIESLFVVIKDLSIYKNLKPIIFLREDIYNQIQYTHLDHYHSIIRNIKWDKDNLLLMLVKRIIALSNNSDLEIKDDEAKNIFYEVFEIKIPNSNAKDCFEWMCKHMMDGRGVITPRDLILLCNQARNEQMSSKYSTTKLISGRAILKAYPFVSSLKLQDLQRIYPETKTLLPLFTSDIVKEKYGRLDKKTLISLFGKKPKEEIEKIINFLIDCGFLRPEDRANPLSSNTFEIPFIYKTALGIKSSGAKKLIANIN